MRRRERCAGARAGLAVDGHDEWLRRVGDPADYVETSIVERDGVRVDLESGEPVSD